MIRAASFRIQNHGREAMAEARRYKEAGCIGSWSDNSAVYAELAESLIGAFLWRLGQEGRDPDQWETEHTVYALACFMGEDYRGAVDYVGQAVLPIPMRDPELVRQMERDAVDFYVPRLDTLQAVFTALVSQRQSSPTIH
jgi:hypothetical protein